MGHLRKTHFAVLLLAVVNWAALTYAHSRPCYAGENEIPVEGAVCHVHRSDGSHKTYLDIVIGHSFEGKLPEDIDHITVTGPGGQLSVCKADFNYNPQWRAFWLVRPGFPEIGKYTFEVAGKNGCGSAFDIQKVTRTIPLPDVSKFKPYPVESNTCLSPVFSWPEIQAAIPLYYQLEIRDINRAHLFRTGFIKDMSEVRLPPDILKPGRKYQWRVRVADGPDWIALDNRSQSRWVTNSSSSPPTPCAYRYRIPRDVDGEWAVSSLEKEGIDALEITAMMQALIKGKIPDIHSVLIVKNGRLVLEEYLNGWARNAKHDLKSASKSVTSILVGIAGDQGKIDSVDTRLYTFFPSYKEIRWEGLKKEIRLKHVLTMSAGLDWNAWEYRDGDVRDTSTAMTCSEDWIKFTLEKKPVEPPGRRFLYNNGLTLLLGEIVKTATGLCADDFAAEHLFRPLGISDFSWGKAAGGIVNTAWGLRLTPRDMAKIGYMMLKDGKYRGRQVVSSKWVKESTKAHLTEDILFGGGYGYQWWRGRAVINGIDVALFYAAGRGGQYIFVAPTLDLVVVFTSKVGNDGLGEFRPQILMVTHILPAMLPAAPSTRTAKIDPKTGGRYAGDYEFKKFDLPLTIRQAGEALFIETPYEAKVRLFPEKANRFTGISEKIGRFSLRFFENPNGQAAHFMLQAGFGFWRFDRIK